MTAGKPRAVRTASGQVGFPGILVYVIQDGPEKGREIPVPPSVSRHPDEASVAFQARQERLRAAGLPTDGMAAARSSVGYTTRIIDRAAFDALDATGFWHSPAHRGRAGVVDRRSAPGT